MAIPDPRDPANQYGEMLARHCRELDTVAEEAGVTSLYELGIQDGSEETRWFAAAEGIDTVDRLLEFLQKPNCSISDVELLKRDLQMLRAVLEEGAEFRLMLV